MNKKSNNSGEMSFLEHLEELRWHIVRSAISVLVLAIIAFIFSRFIFDNILLAPKNPDFFTNRLLCRWAEVLENPTLCINSVPMIIQNIKMAGQFSATIMVSLYMGLIVAFPYVVWELWRFISPALYENERKYARGSVLWISIMFFMGALFGYYLILPLTIHFLGGWQASEQIVTHVDIASYFSIAYIPFASGVIFQLPNLMIFLTKAGLITPSFMVKYRRHAIIILMIVSAVITPPDVLSMMLVILPLMLLYEISIILSKRVVRKKEKMEKMKK